MAEQKRDFWEKLDILMKPLGGLLTALAVTMVGFFTSTFLEKQQAADARVRLYSELMSKREESESALRKDMFVSIIQSFVGSNAASTDTKVLNLELLAYNFHETLNLKPLFLHVDKEVIATTTVPMRTQQLLRLRRVAREVMRKQMTILEGAGRKADRVIDFDDLATNPGGIPLEPITLTLDNITRRFSLFIKQVNPESSEMRMRIEVARLEGGGQYSRPTVNEFWVGPYDFPMIDNTRLLNDQRYAIVLNNFSAAGGADITLSLFPGSYASLKEKPYFDEVVKQLVAEVRK